MESKETALNPASEDSPGSCVSSSFPVDNDVLASKHVDWDENNDDNSRNDSKVVAAEFEAATDKSIPDEIEREGVEEGNSGVLVKVENGGDDVEMREKVVEGDGDEDAVGEGDFADPVEKLGVDFDVGGGDVVDGEGGEAVVEEVEVEGKELKEDGVKVIEPDVEEDSVVESVEVDVASPRAVVVGEPEESIDVASNSGVEVVEAEPEYLEVIDLGESNKTKLEEVKGDSVVDSIQADEVDSGVIVVKEAKENGDREVEEGEVVDETVKSNDDRSDLDAQTNSLVDGISEESKPIPNIQEIRQVEDEKAEIHRRDSMTDGDTEDMIFGSSEAAKKFIEELERESGDGQIVRDSDSDSEEEGETDDEGDGKQLFDPAALVALLKAARNAGPSGGNLTFSMDHPAGLGSSLQSSRVSARPTRPILFGTLATANCGELEENLTQEEKNKLEKLQEIRVKFLRLVRRLGLTFEEPVAAQVLYQLAVLGGRRGTQTYSLDAAKKAALQLEEDEKDSLDFNINILVLGKSGVGKSATVNSLLGEDKAAVDAFEAGTASAVEISGSVEGVKIRIVDTPGLKPSVMEQGINRSVLSSVKKLTKRNPTDVLLYVDRLDAESRDLNDVPLLKTVTNTLGSTVWRNAVVALTHGASAPPEGPLGSCISYETFVFRRSRVVQQCIGHAVGDLRMMSPSLMNPVTLVENHSSCRKNIVGEKILPNGQRWRAQLLLLCYSMKILSEANSVSKPPEPFDHRRLFGLRARTPALPYILSSILQSHPHPKLVSDQGFDSDTDLDEFSDSDQEEDDEYDQLPPFKPLRKAQVAKLSKEQRKAYYEEYDYREKLLQKKQWREELRRMREMKKRGKDGVNVTEYGFAEGDDSASGGSVSVPLPDPALPPSFDGDNPAYRYRSLEPGSRFLARPTLDSHGWDHDCGYEGVLVDHALDIANRLAAAYTVQVRKDKKDFGIHVDSSVAAKQGEKTSHMAGFDIQAIGRQLAYILRAETRTKSFKKNKLTGGVSLIFVGENVVPGVKVEDEIKLGKRYSVLGRGGAGRCKGEAAYGANLEVQRREVGCPVGQVQSTVGVSVVRWRGDLTLGFNGLAQFSLGRNSKVEVQAGVSNKRSGQITVKTSSSEHLSLALAAILPAAVSIFRKFFPSGGDDYAIY